jgi:predicted lipoprotein
MKRNILTVVLFAALASCSKDDKDNGTKMTIEQATDGTLSDFVNVLGEPLYADFVTKATTLNTSVQALIATPTAANQVAAQAAWRDVRITWEQSEGFLIGPVEDDNYDPNMDTWPTDRNQIDSMLNQNGNITSAILDNTDGALKGFHPLEYFLWNADITKLTAAQKNYMTALAANVLSNVKALHDSWTTGGFGNEILNAGKTGSRYTSKEDAVEAIANALIDICNEVGESKMPTPFGSTATDADSTQTESPYSHNSIADFKNNIQGAYNTYTCGYNSKNGTSLSTLVQVNNKSLDTKIKAAFTNALGSFSGFDNLTFELAIYKNRSTVQNSIEAIAALKTVLEDNLVPYVQQYVKN